MLGRLLAAISYIGLFGAFIPIGRPENPFVENHARLAARFHLLRVVLIAPSILLPVIQTRLIPSPDELVLLIARSTFLVLLGLPTPGALPQPGSFELAAFALTWLGSMVGSALALSGLTADWHAFFHADWPNTDAGAARRRTDRAARELAPARDKQELTRLRDTRLERVRSADTVAAQERRRRDTLGSLREEFDDATARRAHLTQLLRLGEVSERRYNEQAHKLDTRLVELSVQIAIHGARQLRVNELDDRRRRELPTDVVIHVPLRTLAITARSGVPLFTYGNFRLDEALVTGILSSFNSLSEEVFGAQIHKTQLAEGQVLFFVHARWTVTMAVYDEEPSPLQMRLLRDLVDEFEQINNIELNRPAPNPARLQELPLPFSFIDDEPST